MFLEGGKHLGSASSWWLAGRIGCFRSGRINNDGKSPGRPKPLTLFTADEASGGTGVAGCGDYLRFHQEWFGTFASGVPGIN
jgi:hypothetical protein